MTSNRFVNRPDALYWKSDDNRGGRIGRMVYPHQNNNVKQCRRCKRLYEINDKNFVYRRRPGREYWYIDHLCRTCYNAQANRSQRKNRGKYSREYMRRRYRNQASNKYLGMDYTEYKAMHGEGCEVCGNDRLSRLRSVKGSENQSIGIICVDCIAALELLNRDADTIASLEAFTYRMKTYGGNIPHA